MKKGVAPYALEIKISNSKPFVKGFQLRDEMLKYVVKMKEYPNAIILAAFSNGNKILINDFKI